MREFICALPEDTMAAGAEVAKLLRPGDTVALRGELGAGKTVFVRGPRRPSAAGSRSPAPPLQ